MYSPFRHEVSHTMTNRKQVRFPKKKPKQPRQNQRKAKKTPFGDVGHILGNAIGSMFGADFSGPGRWLGTGIGSIFGSGDYTVTGPVPKSNVLVNSAEIPQFSTTRQTNVVCHREYLQDWTGSSAFVNKPFKLNPGDESTFPWLSSIAQNYQEYKFHGLVFEFKPLITDYVTGGAPGVVIMATNYNASEAAYASKQQMENSEFAVSVKPTHNLMHGVECDPGQTPNPIKYVRDGTLATAEDAKLYDWGTFQFANQGSPSQLLGEIWVSYCVEFFKPIIPETVGGTITSSTRGGSIATGSAIFGEIQLYNKGTANITISGNTLLFDSDPSMYYLIEITWKEATPIVIAYPAIALVGAVSANFFEPTVAGASTWYAYGSSNGVTTNSATLSICIKSNQLSPGSSGVTLSTFVVPADTVEVSVTQLDVSLFA